jgi:photosystem II stability/assembly factor-like uncharacterized protein
VTSLVPRQDFVNGMFPPGLYRTDDGGRSWQVVRIPMPAEFPPELTNPVTNSEGHVFCGIANLELIQGQAFTFDWVCSLEDYASLPIHFNYKYLTADGGQSWHAWLATNSESFAEAGAGWRLFDEGGGQQNELQQSLDGGLTWTALKKVAWPEVKLDFVSARTGWAIVTGGNDAYALVHTTDGGRFWSGLDSKAGRYQAPKSAGPNAIPLPLLPAATISRENAGQVIELARRSGVLPCPGYWSQDGRLLAVAGVDDVNVYESRTLNPVPFIPAEGCAFAFSGDWSKVAVRTEADGISIRRVADGAILQTLNVSGEVDQLAFSRDGSLLALGSDQRLVTLWQASDGALLYTLEGKMNLRENLTFSPDGKLLAYGVGRAVGLWDTASGRELRTLQEDPGVPSVVSFSPDGSRLAAGMWDGSLSLWQLQDGSVLSLSPAGSQIRSVSFSPDGSLLASGAEDGSIKLWDCATGQLLATLVGHTNWVSGVAFSPDGLRLLSTSADGTLRVWGVPAAGR